LHEVCEVDRIEPNRAIYALRAAAWETRSCRRASGPHRDIPLRLVLRYCFGSL